jgi:hypothetical protein
MSGFFVGRSVADDSFYDVNNLERRRKPVGSDSAHYHDSEIGDIYDLFNACNGIVRDGYLDVQQLDQYSPEEAETLNIIRLREVWEHTITGCLHCRHVVDALRVLHSMSDIS